MNHFRASILALFLPAVCILDAFADSNLLVAAQETRADVTPRASHVRLIDLPALSFDLFVQIDCPGSAESLTLSIADTLITLTKEDIEHGLSTEASLRVPARQLTLAASNRFCLLDDAATLDELLVPGFTTAHASLRCEGEDGPSVHFASAPLQVRLKCSREPGETQEASLDK